ncbi:hypothetical protein BE17_02310 [Sorangium cellulosum]|uniref:Recombinase domain-containing protein n=1 Tax=Sorangium cellulosum TaxID=56 RepID=A0A150S137_SORCE|nr:hypothetical protein BE17_02310 [Sorangium cellulosum]
MRDAAAQERLDAVVMYDAERLARRFVEQQVSLDELTRKGVELIFIHGEVARTDEERTALSKRGVFAEYKRAKILDPTRRGMLHRARSGAPPGWANPPSGYRYLPGARHQPGTVVVEECEASVVRSIFAWVGHEGLPPRRVAQRLEQQGIASRGGRPWQTSTIGGSCLAVSTWAVPTTRSTRPLNLNARAISATTAGASRPSAGGRAVDRHERSGPR